MSSRLQPRRSVKTVLSYYEDTQESEDDYNSDDGHGRSAPSPRRGKTKPEQGGSEAKQTRRRRSGKLSKFPAMPLDVMYEVSYRCLVPGQSLRLRTQIFSLLHPRDLLRVSWTTKAFRAVLNDRSSKPIWRTSLASIDGLPPCPKDLSEPMYAALLFSPYCSVRDGSLVVFMWPDSSGCDRNAPSHGPLLSGSFPEDFVNRAFQFCTSHYPYNQSLSITPPLPGRVVDYFGAWNIIGKKGLHAAFKQIRVHGVGEFLPGVYMKGDSFHSDISTGCSSNIYSSDT